MDQYFEDLARSKGYRYPVGLDEVGRGPLAGPVVAAACYVSPEFANLQINDSKKLTEKVREELFELLTSSPDVEYGIGIVDHETIDQINILQASLLAMKEAFDALEMDADFAWVDGNQMPDIPVNTHGIIKGDTRCLSIAAASIIAKVTRDRIVSKYDEKWPEYQFSSHKGYATKQHVAMLQKYGPLPIHRKSFQTVADLLVKG